MCTAIRFTDPDGNLYFGRNLDWAYDYGETITFTPRNHPANTGHRAVLGMAIASAGFALCFDCANENGLAIAGLNFPATPTSPDDVRLEPRPWPVRVPLVGHLELTTLTTSRQRWRTSRW